MKKLSAIVVILLVGASYSFAQEFGKSQGTPTHELFLQVQSSSNADKIEVSWSQGHTSSPTLKHTLIKDSGSFEDWCDNTTNTPEYHWVGEVGDTFGAGETCTERDSLDYNEMYTLKFESFESNVSKYEATYMYFNCASGWDSTLALKEENGFYCLKMQTGGNYVDLTIELTSDGFGMVMTDAGSDGYKYMEDVYADSKWIFPHHAEYYCANSPISPTGNTEMVL